MQSTNIYNEIYAKLLKVIPNLEEHLETGCEVGKSQSEGFMDLHFDYLGSEGKGVHKISLAQYFKQNGDMVPDPDMEVRVFLELKAAEAMTFQNQWTYDQVYEEHEGKKYVRPKLKEDLNIFLNQWLQNCIEQGHFIAIHVPEAEREVSEQNPQQEKADEKEIQPSDDLTAMRKSSLNRSNNLDIIH